MSSWITGRPQPAADQDGRCDAPELDRRYLGKQRGRGEGRKEQLYPMPAPKAEG